MKVSGLMEPEKDTGHKDGAMDQCIEVNGKMINWKVKVNWSTHVVIFMKVSGRTTKPMGMEFINNPTFLDTKAPGYPISRKDMGSRLIRTPPYTRVSITAVLKTEKGFSNSQMGLIMKVNFITTRFTVAELTHGWTVRCTKVNGKNIKCIEKGS